MERKARWLGKNRRLGTDRRRLRSADYAGPERRSSTDRRYRLKQSLLVVDSSPSHLFYMGMLLKKLEYDVRTARTAEDALQSLPESPPTLIITESTLPRMSGINMLKQMRRDQRFKTIPVIFHTSDGDPAVRTACKVEGCAGFFKKPAQPGELYRVIQAATESAPRRTIRITTTLSVEVGDGSRPGETVRTETVTSLSDGGLFVKTLSPEPAHTVLPLVVIIRNRMLKATGIVLYGSSQAGEAQKEPGMALRFVDISPEDKKFVRDFVQEEIMKGMALPKGS
jgi:two-component system chemotaxis response regulator CheY